MLPPPSAEKTLEYHLQDQGDQMGRIFAYRVVVDFGTAC
jgi:hypothetical protein